MGAAKAIGFFARLFGRAIREERAWRREHPLEFAEDLEDRARRRYGRGRHGLARIAWDRADAIRTANRLGPPKTNIDGRLLE